jgi:hypothetical protein
VVESERLLSCLIAAKVDFVIVGGFAANAHGVPLLTQDVDVCCDFSLDNLERLQSALKDLHPVHRMTPKRLPLGLSAGGVESFKNLYLDTDEGQLDCLSMIDGIGGFDAVRENSVEVELPAGVCRVLSLDALIRAKEAMDRPRDREAALQLRAIRERSQPPD